MALTCQQGNCRPGCPIEGTPGRRMPDDETLTFEFVYGDRVDGDTDAYATCRLLASLVTRYLLAATQQDEGGA